MEGTDMATSRRIEAENILLQTRDTEEAYAAGVIDEEARVAARTRRIAALQCIAALDAGEEVDDEAFIQMLDDARALAELPTEAELQRADIDYLLMMGGE